MTTIQGISAMTDHADAFQGGSPPMARETKVGLLAGLAFVICFAIILTNRGHDSAVAPPRFGLSPSGGEVPKNVQEGALRPPRRPAPVTPTGGAEVAFFRPSRVPDVANPSPSSVLPPDLTGRNPVSETADPALPTPLPQTTLIPSPSNNPIQEPVSTGIKHTVAPGETLSKIALAHFGSKSRSVVDSIYAANKAVMQSPDNLKVGMVLTLPNSPSSTKADAAQAPKSDSAASQKPAANPAKSADEPKVAQSKTPADAARFYQVKKNDRWVSIAREQLGDAGRWKELHELNKDKFPDPSKIREGVRIKLPGGKSVASAEGRR